MKKAILCLLVLIAAFGIFAGGTAEADQNEEKAKEPVTLKVLMSFPRFRDQFEDYFTAFAEKQAAEQGLDVTIKLEMPNSEQVSQILKARLVSNDAPDLFTVHAIADIPTFYEAGYLADLSQEPFVNTLFESVKNTVTYDNKVLALPLEGLAWGYLYNQDMFAKYGLTPPQTLKDMEEVISTLEANGETAFILSFQESWIPQLMMALSLGGVVNSEYPGFIADMNNESASYDDVKDVFNIIDMIMQHGTDRPFQVGSASGSSDFAMGKAAMWVQGPWMAESILKVNPDMKIGVAPLPVSNDPSAAMINLSTSTSLAMSPTTKHPETASALLNYILDEQDSSALFQSLKFNPVSEVHNYESFPWVDEAMGYVAQGKAYQDLSLPGGVTDETAKMLQTYYTGDVTKEEIISALDNAWAAALKSKQ